MVQNVYPPPRAPGLMDVVYFTASGTFNKADYPGAQSVRVRVQAGGGGGANAAATGAGQVSIGESGGGGGYAESLLDIGALASSETVTVGAGGVVGGAGGDSSFGVHVVAGGGSAGANNGPASPARVVANPANGGSATVGDILIPGGKSLWGQASDVDRVSAGSGGDAQLGRGGQTNIASNLQTGHAGQNYGGGGSGAANGQNQTATTGGAGAPGIVIVEIYSTYAGNTGDFAMRSSSVASSDSSVNNVVTMTTAEYNAATKDPNTLYLVVD